MSFFGQSAARFMRRKDYAGLLGVILTVFITIPAHAADFTNYLMESYYWTYTGGYSFLYPLDGSTLGSSSGANYNFPGNTSDHYHLLGCMRHSGLTMLYGDEIWAYTPPESYNFGVHVCSSAVHYCPFLCPDTDFPDALSLGVIRQTPPYFSVDKFVKIDLITATSIDPNDGAVMGDFRWISSPVDYFFYVYKEQSCDLKIINFLSDRSIVDPSVGENVVFSGNMTESSGQTVNWTVAIQGVSGASWRTFSGIGISPVIFWDGRDSFSRIADDGLYTATINARTADGECGKTATAQVNVKSSCGDIWLSASPDTLMPTSMGQDDLTRASISIGLSKPAPAAGCDIRLSVEGVEGSGGHDHIGNRNGHTGDLSSNFVLFAQGETSASVEYRSGEVAGSERIIAELLDGNGNIRSTTNITINAKVPDLSLLGGFISYNLTGSTLNHSANHYALPSTNSAISDVADQYFIRTGALLGINDMSLAWGGLFDIDGHWSPPHSSHRKGTSVDIDLNADMSGSYIPVDRQQLERIARVFGGRRVIEPTIHYEFE